MAKPNFTLPNKPAIKSGSILSYNYTDDFTFVPAPLTFNRDSAATRVNEKGLIEDVGYFGSELVQNGDFEEIGSELVVNGTFDTDINGWVAYGGDTVINWDSNGYLEINNSVNGYWCKTRQQNVFEIGKTYFIEITAKSNIANKLFHNLFSDKSFSQVDTFETISGYYTAIGTDFDFGYHNVASQDTTITIDNISVKEVGQNWSFGTGWSIEDVNGNQVAKFDGGADAAIQQGGLLTSGKKYRLSIDVANKTTGSLQIRFGNTGVVDETITTNGTFTYDLVSDGTTLYLRSIAGFDGYIDNVSVIEILGDKPRIDYSDSLTEPSLLLEPQSTNLIEYSEDFNSWTKTGNTTISATNIKSPSGENNATNITGLNGSSSNDLRFFPSGFNSANKTLSFSLYLKGSGTLSLQMSNGIDQGSRETITLTSNWKRHILTATFNSTTSSSFHVNIDDYNSATATSYDIWGAQLEELSYPTSYIPTAGSTATRLGETANNAGDVNVFNSEEGVLYTEIAALANSGTIRYFGLNDGSNNNRALFLFDGTANRVRAIVSSGGTKYVDFHYTVTDLTEFHKIALKYKDDDFALWVDGVERNADTSGLTPVGLDNLEFDLNSGGAFYGKVRNVKVFNKALTDRELEILTIQ